LEHPQTGFSFGDVGVAAMLRLVATIMRFEDIEAWRSARQLRRSVSALTRSPAFACDRALVNQIRRAAISSGSNIAEGFDRGGNREFIQFLSTAKGSVAEIKDQLYCALDEAYISKEQFAHTYALADATARLIGAFMVYLRGSTITGHKFDTATARTNSKLQTQNS
jgi:four helix bundle protein